MIVYVTGLEIAHMSNRLDTSHGGTLRVTLTMKLHLQANVRDMAKLRQRKQKFYDGRILLPNFVGSASIYSGVFWDKVATASVDRLRPHYPP